MVWSSHWVHLGVRSEKADMVVVGNINFWGEWCLDGTIALIAKHEIRPNIRLGRQKKAGLKRKGLDNFFSGNRLTIQYRTVATSMEWLHVAFPPWLQE